MALIRHKQTASGFVQLQNIGTSGDRPWFCIVEYATHEGSDSVTLVGSEQYERDDKAAFAAWEKIPAYVETYADCGHCGEPRDDNGSLCPNCLNYN